MSRRRSRPDRDSLAERVSDDLLRSDIEKAINAQLNRWDRVELDLYLRGRWSLDSHEAGEAMRRLRESRQYERLVPYLFNGDLPTQEDRCRGCRQLMETPEPGKRGRPRQYCSTLCQKRASYRRNLRKA